MGAKLRKPSVPLAWGKGGAGTWAASRAHQLLTSPLLFPGFLLQAFAFLPLLAELRLLWGQNQGLLRVEGGSVTAGHLQPLT